MTRKSPLARSWHWNLIPPLEFGCFAERRVLGLRVDPDQRQLELGAGRFLDTKIRRGDCIAFEAGDKVNLTKQESNGLFVCLRRVGFGSDLCFWTLAAWLTEAQL
jgi:hypothetical protein